MQETAQGYSEKVTRALNHLLLPPESLLILLPLQRCFKAGQVTFPL